MSMIRIIVYEILATTVNITKIYCCFLSMFYIDNWIRLITVRCESGIFMYEVFAGCIPLKLHKQINGFQPCPASNLFVVVRYREKDNHKIIFNP